jgi:predicted ArsR family transcriptional regulator
MARRLGITAMAVRQHLYRLSARAMVDYRDERRPVGRPARLWRLTDRAASKFPDSHAELTLEMIRAIRQTFGEAGLDRLLAERTRIQARAYRESIRRSGGQTLEARVRALAAIRRSQGYMAEYARRADGAFVLRENHCPICAAARTCQGLCREELSLFQTVLGPQTIVERVDHLLAGASRCAYLISPRDERRSARGAKAGA